MAEDEDEFALRLGRAAIGVWGDIPRDAQEALFETALRGREYRAAVVATTAELQRELERLQRRTQAAIAAGRPRDLAGVDAGGTT